MKQQFFNCTNQHLWLSSDRAIYWEEQNTLILSDSHFGKTGHFRKSGIPLPQSIFLEDLQRLFGLVQLYQPAQLIVVGDMFHSHANKEHLLFEKWRNDFHQLHFILVKGNHDILDMKWYEQINIKVCSDAPLLVPPFAFIHDFSHIDNFHECRDSYFFTGHLHPGILIKGRSRQQLNFPCFYFGERYAVLPAFSKFSGLSIMKKKKTDTVFAIVGNELIEV
ncbi:MAG: ligase-associated DNA damage response endonuclease PdeM [Bacteroidetes bacterium]|nr:ligase-associated DNA damage response endonuclease PdeM [Bacteroidota bacterium]